MGASVTVSTYPPGFAKFLRGGVYYFFLSLLALPFILPLLWALSTAFKPRELIYSSPPQWVMSSFTLENFRESWQLLDFPRFFGNSLLVAGLSTLGSVISSSLVGFAFATLPGRGKRILFALMLATIMMPTTLTLIPLLILFSKLGWVNTYLPLVVPQFLANAFYVFLFRQFFRGLPGELFESAELDGCNPFTSYLQIALPLSHPALATAAIFSFIGSWNDFLTPLVFISTSDKFTLSLGLSLFQGIHYTQLHYLMPMSLLTLLPVLILFSVAQIYFTPRLLPVR